jgi:hypothetical protein
LGTFLIALLLSTPFTLKAMAREISVVWSKATGWLLGDMETEDEPPEPESHDAPADRTKRKEKPSSPPVQTELFPRKQNRRESISPASVPVR